MAPQRGASLDAELRALLMMGDVATRDDDFELALRCYQQALRRDETNVVALLNVGVTRVELHRFEHALLALRRMETTLSRRRPGDDEVDLQLNGRYNAALAHWSLAQHGDEVDAGHLQEALVMGRQVALDVGTLSLRPRLPEARRRVLAALEGGGLTLLAGIIVDAFDAGVELGPHAGPEPIDAAPAADAPAELPEWLMKLAGDRWYRGGTPPILAKAARANHAKDPRTRYNLAVLGARRLRRNALAHGLSPSEAGEWYARYHPRRTERAFVDLEFAVTQDPGLARWAAEDVLLAPLFHAGRRRFRALVPSTEEPRVESASGG